MCPGFLLAAVAACVWPFLTVLAVMLTVLNMLIMPVVLIFLTTAVQCVGGCFDCAYCVDLAALLAGGQVGWLPSSSFLFLPSANNTIVTPRSLLLLRGTW